MRYGASLGLMIGMLLVLAATAAGADLGTAFTYQGRLVTGGNPANGTYDFQFTLYDADNGGANLGTVTVDDVAVAGGLFTAALDFGDGAMTGQARWLAIGVRPGASTGAYTALSPRQELRPSPHALALPALRVEQNVLVSNVVGGHPSNTVTEGKAGATIGGGDHNEVTDYLGTVGGGEGNTAAAAGSVGGGLSNAAIGFGAAIAGGDSNLVEGTDSSIAGGFWNTCTGEWSFIGGGYANSAVGDYATVPGGRRNEADGDFSFAAGRRAKANHAGSFVLADSTDADFASVRADALRVRFNGGATFQVNSGSWFRIWNDSGRVVDTSTGAHLTTGGAWVNGSRRASKENFGAVDAAAVLEQVAALPVLRWNYIAEDDAVQHIGPVAEDFRAAFGVGAGDGIATVDADGVALAAIQALHAQVQELRESGKALQAQNNALQAQNNALQAQNESLQTANIWLAERLTALETRVAAMVPDQRRDHAR